MRHIYVSMQEHLCEHKMVIMLEGKIAHILTFQFLSCLFSLAVIDDAPRDEFTPRHRHTLKEFAAIAMREMELWRDKVRWSFF